MKYLFEQFLVLILFNQEVFSKSSDGNEFGVDSKNLNFDETDSNQFELEDDANFHEFYRPKNKYKIRSDSQALSNRFERNSNEIQESKDIKTPQCAIMFKNNEPVGILQPFEDSYKFLPINGEPTVVDISPVVVKRKSIMDVLYPSNEEDTDYDDYKAEDKVGFSDDRYPSIFAKFKIDSRLHRGTKRSLLKRQIETPSISENQLGSLKTTLSKMKSDDSIEVEEELKNILDDMGLIDDYPSDKDLTMKREVYDEKREVEDENLELGTNRINLIRETQRDLREKRNEFNSGFQDSNLSAYRPSMAQRMTESIVDLLKVDNDNNNNNDNEVMECRSEKIDTFKNEQKRDKMSNSDEHRRKREKHNQENDMPLLECSTVNLVQDNERNQHEERVEREIRDKIQKLKEEVKKEIEQLRSSKKSSDSEESKRRKRQVNSLIDSESKEIDPTFNDVDNHRIHVRRKRKIPVHNPTKINHENASNGIISQDLSGKVYRTRSLKHISSTDEKYKKHGVQHTTTMKIVIRRKREVKGVVDELEENGNDAEFNEEERMDFDQRNEAGYAQGNSKKNCNCDKNGNCKCDTSGMSDNNLSNIEEYSKLIDPMPLTKKSSNNNCDCDKNGNCKCSNQYSEVANKNCECDKNGNCKCERQYSEFTPFSNSQNDSSYGQYPMKKRSVNRQTKTGKRKIRYVDKVSGPEDINNAELKINEKKREMKSHQFENGEYYVDLHPDIYRLTPVDNSRSKREDFDTLVAIHGGGPVRNHLVAIRQRSMLPHSRFRRRIKTEDNNSPRQLIDMSEEELFGALPQSFEGELARYKRVKRGKRKT